MVSVRFWRVVSGVMASSRVVMVWRMGKKASMPCWLQRLASGVVQPEKARTVLLYFFCDGGDTDGGFSHDGLAIEAAFTGDHDVSIFDAGFQSGFFQDDLDAGLENGICVGKESETESTGGSGARVVRVGIRVFFTGDVGVGGKPLIHLADHVRSGSFLRPEDGAAALGTTKRVGYIAGDFKVTIFEVRENMCVVDCCNL